MARVAGRGLGSGVFFHNRNVNWEATDQFGNLYVGKSNAASLEELRPHVESLLEKLQERCDGPVQVTIDLQYGQINGPHPEQVSHVLNVPLLENLAASGMGPQQILTAICEMVPEDSMITAALAYNNDEQ